MMGTRRSVTDFPRSEPGLVDNFLGTSYDVVKKVYDNLDSITEVAEIVEDIPGMVDEAIEEAMVPVRIELDAAVTASAASAAAAAQSASEAETVATTVATQVATDVSTALVDAAVTDLESQLAGKEPSIPTSTADKYWKGDKSWSTFAADVRGTVLTGLVMTSGVTITAVDSVLTALGKLQRQITDVVDNIETSVRSTALTGVNFTVGTAIVAADTVLSAMGKLQKQITDVVNGISASVRGTVLTGFTVGSNTSVAATDTVLQAFSKTQGQLDVREPAITGGSATQYWKGDKSWGTFATDVRATTLTGIVFTTGSAVVAADSVLVAAGKLQKQVTDLGTGKEPALGFVPVQQGTGIGQGANTIKLGYAAGTSDVKITVDTTDLGGIVMKSFLTSSLTGYLQTANLMTQFASSFLPTQVGGFVLMKNISGSTIANNTSTPASSLQFSDTLNGNNGAPTGTWRCCGITVNNASGLFQRTA